MFFEPVTWVILVVTCVLLRWCFKEPANLPPGPRRWPVIGSLLTFIKYPVEKGYLGLYELAQKYGGLFTLKIGSLWWVVIADPNIAKEIYVKQAANFSDRPIDNKMMRTLEEKLKCFGIIWASGECKKEVRRFTISAMREFGFGKRTMACRIKEEVQAMLDEVRKVEGRAWNPHPLLMKAVSNVINSICNGDRYAYDDPAFNKMMDLMEDMSKSFTFTETGTIFTWLEFLPLSKRIHEAMVKAISIDRHIDQQIKDHALDFDPNQPRDFVDLFLQKQQDGSDNIINVNRMRQIISDLYFAGTDTTSTAVTWALLFLIGYPDVQKKCQEEIDKVIGSSRGAEVEDRMNMPYMEATINEVLRLSSTAPMNIPHIANETCTVRGYTIPAGCTVVLAIYAINMDPKLWPEPHLFSPERWLDEDRKVKKHDAYVGFGVGPRGCLGEQLSRQEMFFFLTGLLQQFCFLKETPDTVLSYEGVQGITLQPKPFKIIPKARQ